MINTQEAVGERRTPSYRIEIHTVIPITWLHLILKWHCFFFWFWSETGFFFFFFQKILFFLRVMTLSIKQSGRQAGTWVIDSAICAGGKNKVWEGEKREQRRTPPQRCGAGEEMSVGVSKAPDFKIVSLGFRLSRGSRLNYLSMFLTKISRDHCFTRAKS